MIFKNNLIKLSEPDQIHFKNFALTLNSLYQLENDKKIKKQINKAIKKIRKIYRYYGGK